MNQELKYYIHIDDIIIFPKIIFNFKISKFGIRILEWIEFINFFKNLCEKLDFYILRCIINDYSYPDNQFTSREIITKIVLNLNLYLFDTIHFEYFNTFDDTIKRFRNLYNTMNDNYIFDLDRKYKFIYFLISFLELLYELNEIFEHNYISIDNTYFNKYFSLNQKEVNIEFKPITGGYLNNKKIMSFWISKNLVTNYQYLKFIESFGYKNKSYWSNEGLYWLNYYNYSCPKNWINIENNWYVNGTPINDVKNYPVIKLSIYEAEAFARFMEAEIPTEEELNWVSTNRNKSKYPTGVELNNFLFFTKDLKSVNNEDQISLMGINQLFGNVWQYTSSKNKDSKIIVKGGDYLTPQFILNTNLKMEIPSENRKYNIGFRIIKYS